MSRHIPLYPWLVTHSSRRMRGRRSENPGSCLCRRSDCRHSHCLCHSRPHLGHTASGWCSRTPSHSPRHSPPCSSRRWRGRLGTRSDSCQSRTPGRPHSRCQSHSPRPTASRGRLGCSRSPGQPPRDSPTHSTSHVTCHTSRHITFIVHAKYLSLVHLESNQYLPPYQPRQFSVSLSHV